MFEFLVEQIKALVGERGSAQALLQHVSLLQAQHSAEKDARAQAESARAVLEAQRRATQAQLDEALQRLQAYEADNPNRERCDHRGSGQLKLVGQRRAALGGEFLLKEAVLDCQACGGRTVCAVPPPF